MTAALTSSLCNHISHLKIMNRLQGLLQRAEESIEEQVLNHRVQIGAQHNLPTITRRSVVEKIHHQTSMRPVGLNLNILMHRRKSLHIFLLKSLLLWILRNLHFRYRCMKRYRRSTRDRRIETNSKRPARKQASTQTTSQREVSHLQVWEVRLKVLQSVKKISRRVLHHARQKSFKIRTKKMTFSQMQTKEALLVVTLISILEETRFLRLSP